MARLIDSGVFIELERRGLPLGALAVGAADEPFAIATITVDKLLYGVERANSGERRRRRAEFVDAILATIPVLPLDVPTARVQAELWAVLEADGQRIGPYDLIVAATALARGYDVVTFNVREFERVPGLAVLRPEW